MEKTPLSSPNLSPSKHRRTASISTFTPPVLSLSQPGPNRVLDPPLSSLIPDTNEATQPPAIQKPPSPSLPPLPHSPSPPPSLPPYMPSMLTILGIVVAIIAVSMMLGATLTYSLASKSISTADGRTERTWLTKHDDYLNVVSQDTSKYTFYDLVYKLRAKRCVYILPFANGLVDEGTPPINVTDLELSFRHHLLKHPTWKFVCAIHTTARPVYACMLRHHFEPYQMIYNLRIVLWGPDGEMTGSNGETSIFCEPGDVRHRERNREILVEYEDHLGTTRMYHAHDEDAFDLQHIADDCSGTRVCDEIDTQKIIVTTFEMQARARGLLRTLRAKAEAQAKNVDMPKLPSS